MIINQNSTVSAENAWLIENTEDTGSSMILHLKNYLTNQTKDVQILMVNEDYETKQHANETYSPKEHYHQQYIEKSSDTGLLKPNGDVDTTIYLTKTLGDSYYQSKGQYAPAIHNHEGWTITGTTITEDSITISLFNAITNEEQALSIPTNGGGGSGGSSGGANLADYATKAFVASLYSLKTHNHDATYIKKSTIAGLAKNDGTIDENEYLTTAEAQSLYQEKGNYATSNHNHDAVYVKKSQTEGLLKNNGTVDVNTYLTTTAAANQYQTKGNYALSNHNHDTTYVKLSSESGLLKNDGSVDKTKYLSTTSAASQYQPKGNYANVNHSHTKSNITDFAHTHTASDMSGLSLMTLYFDDGTSQNIRVFK